MKTQYAQKQQAKKPVMKKCTNSACRKLFPVNESCTCPFCGKFYPRLNVNGPILLLDYDVWLLCAGEQKAHLARELGDSLHIGLRQALALADNVPILLMS